MAANGTPRFPEENESNVATCTKRQREKEKFQGPRIPIDIVTFLLKFNSQDIST